MVGAATVRLLGTAVPFVFCASLVSEQLLASVVGSVSSSELLATVSANLQKIRISVLDVVVSSVGINALAVLFFRALSQLNQTLARVALEFWLAESVVLAISKLGSLGLNSISQQYVAVGEIASAQEMSVAEFLYQGIDRRGYDPHMLFFSLGGILRYYLLHQARLLPSELSLWGLVSVSLLSLQLVVQPYNKYDTS